MQTLSYLLAAFLGLSIGSFLGALTYRKPQRLSVLKGRSFCPHCKTTIAWVDNIPVLSYLLLGGRCRACGRKISVRYPLVEVLLALIFVILFRLYSFPYFLYFSAISALTVAVIVIDLEHKIIPDEIIFLGILFVFGFYLLFSPDLIFPNFLVGFTTSIFFLAIHLLTRGRGMGLGDVKFVIFGGLLLGWPATVVWLFVAFAAGAAIGLFLILLKKAKFGQEIPFGPFLGVALLFTMVYGEALLSFYLK